MSIKLHEIFSDLYRYGSMVRDIVESLANSLSYLDSFRAGEARLELAKAIDIDRKADRYRREIIENKLIGIEDSIARSYIHNILRMLDRVGEWAKESIRYLDLIPYIEMPSPIKETIHDMIKTTVKGIEKIIEALELMSKDKYNSITKLCEEVEAVEENVDELLHIARKNIVVYSSKVQNQAIVMFLKDFIESIETMTDYEEDAADIIKALTIYLKH
uniref:DUF47 family protein n=1 Tax=Ignisphaera aggregans TaxID=334771 RepID=A0A7C5YTZ5_9CREN